MKNIFTTICFSPKKGEDIDEIIKILENIKSDYIHKTIKVLNRPTIVFEIEEGE